MSRYLETIKVQNRQLYNVEEHNERFNRTRREVFGCTTEYDLADIIRIPEWVTHALYKCRVIYSNNIEFIEFQLYQRPTIRSLRLVRADFLEYKYKSLERTIFDELKKGVKEDDIIIVKNNFITDCSFANLVFTDRKEWVTPSTPLLAGTKRARLLKEGKIIERTITLDEIWKYKTVICINALLDIEDNCSIPLSHVFPLQDM
ncbi:MAG: aminotransferase class IV [Bacteroidetes bacterium]|nr:aminotransferase class IV [Bacteroidota bacterium]